MDSDLEGDSPVKVSHGPKTDQDGAQTLIYIKVVSTRTLTYWLRLQPVLSVKPTDDSRWHCSKLFY